MITNANEFKCSAKIAGSNHAYKGIISGIFEMKLYQLIDHVNVRIDF